MKLVNKIGKLIQISMKQVNYSYLVNDFFTILFTKSTFYNARKPKKSVVWFSQKPGPARARSFCFRARPSPIKWRPDQALAFIYFHFLLWNLALWFDTTCLLSFESNNLCLLLTNFALIKHLKFHFDEISAYKGYFWFLVLVQNHRKI